MSKHTTKILKLNEIAFWWLHASMKEDRPKVRAALPSLQRGFVWKTSQIELLWDSIAQGFPIGSLLLSAYGNECSDNAFVARKKDERLYADNIYTNKLDNVRISFYFPFEKSDIEGARFMYLRTVEVLSKIESNSIMLHEDDLYDIEIDNLLITRVGHDALLWYPNHTIECDLKFIRLSEISLLVLFRRPKVTLYGEKIIDNVDVSSLPDYFQLSRDKNVTMITVEGDMYYEDMERIGEKVDILSISKLEPYL